MKKCKETEGSIANVMYMDEHFLMYYIGWLRNYWYRLWREYDKEGKQYQVVTHDKFWPDI